MRIRSSFDSIVSYVRRHPIIIVLSIAAVLLGGAYVIRKFTPKTAELVSIGEPDLQPLISPRFSEAKITLPDTVPTLPDALPVYTATPVEMSVQQLKTTFELQETKYPNHYSNEEKHRMLIFDPSAKRYEYTDTAHDGDVDPAFASRINASRAVQIAQQFVHETLSLPSFSPVIPEIKYYSKSSDEGEPLDAKDANVAEIPFTLELQKKPSFGGRQIAYPLLVYVDSADKVYGFRMDQTVYTSTSPRTVTTITVDEIITMVKKGNADILKLYGEDPESFQLQNITAVDIGKVDVEYRYVPKSGLTIPYFHCTAQITLAAGTTLGSEFLVPAVRVSSK